MSWPTETLVVPSILSADFGAFRDQVRELLDAGARAFHVDVMDGHFVPVITFGPQVVAAIADEVHDRGAVLDVHLMIEEPERYVDDFARAGADSISVHLEASPHLHRTVQQIKSLNKKASVAVNPHTSLDGLDVVLPDLDMVLLMTVNPGFGGQRFIEAVVPKIAALRATIERRGLATDIEVDGGVAPDTVARVVGAGANVLVAGSAIFGAPGHDYRGAIQALRDGAASARRDAR